MGDRLRRRAATTPSTPTSAPSRTSTPSSRAPRELGLEVALDLALQCAPRTTRGSTEHPEWFTTRADGTHRLRREPAEEVPGHLPAQLRQRPGGHLRTRSCGSSSSGSSHGVRIFRVDNPHTKPVRVLGVADRARSTTTDPDVLFLAEAFTRPAMMHALGRGRLPPVLHLLHLAHHQGGARGVPHRGQPRVRRPTSGRTSSSTPPTSSRVPAVRRPGGVQDPRRARRDRSPHLGRLRRLRAVRARGRRARQRGVPRQREVRVSRPATGTPRRNPRAAPSRRT